MSNSDFAGKCSGQCDSGKVARNILGALADHLRQCEVIRLSDNAITPPRQPGKPANYYKSQGKAPWPLPPDAKSEPSA